MPSGPEKRREQVRRRRERNPELERARDRDYYARTKERRRELSRKAWHALPDDVKRARGRRAYLKYAYGIRARVAQLLKYLEKK